MIPIIYKLRDCIRFEYKQDSVLIVSEVPLNVVRASKRVAEILQLCNGERSLRQISEETGIRQEDRVFSICDYFNKRAFLETSLQKTRDYHPSVTVVIPSKDRKEELGECLNSVFSQEYPADKIEIIVFDDGSRDGTHNLEQLRACRVFTNQESRGQSYCRNVAATTAKGEILAFLDSDCVAGPSWLKDLVQCFQWDRIGAVGGYVDGYFDQSGLDRYERVFSSLHLGKYIQLGLDDGSGFYIPTCNLLVKKDVFLETGGLRESLHLGEDVDFCWRMRKTGRLALYVPCGKVKHKHRNRLGPMLRRRFDYGTSEGALYELHPEKGKILQMRSLPTVAFIGLCLSFLLLNPLFLLAPAACFLFEANAKIIRLRRTITRINSWKVFYSMGRVYISSFYFLAFHVTRYYLLPLILLGFALHSLWIFGAVLLIFAALVDYSVKRPKLIFPLFLSYYTFDHISYQLGVVMGCIRKRSFRPYKIKSVSG
jgi:mycofactocin system glycosyltransferase